jgi:methionine transaminase
LNFSGTLPSTKLPSVGTTIFTEMSTLASRSGALNAAQGFPDFGPPIALIEAVTTAMAEGHNQYAPMAGNADLRDWIAGDIERRTGLIWSPEHEITIGAGASSLLFAAIQALVREGDEVIIFDPAYDLYAPAVKLTGGELRRIGLQGPDYALDVEALKTVLNRRTRLVLINAPHNPTGSCLTRKDLDRLHLALRGSDAILLSDEVYGPLVYDGREAVSAFQHHGLAERTLVAGSFGKILHATGWKIGNLVGPQDLMREVRKVHQYDVFSTGAPLQQGISQFLNSAEGATHLAELPAFYQSKRDQLLELLDGSPWRLTPAQGGYFQVLDYAAFESRADQVVCRERTALGPAGIATIPMSSFYDQNHPERQHSTRIRVCFAKESATLTRVAEQLKSWACE